MRPFRTEFLEFLEIVDADARTVQRRLSGEVAARSRLDARIARALDEVERRRAAALATTPRFR